jgi:hypothetical protein
MGRHEYEAPEVEDAGAEEAPAITAAGISVTDTEL